MNFSRLCGRVAQFAGLAVGLFFIALFLAAKFPLGPLSNIELSFVEAGGSPRELLAIALAGFAMFVVGFLLFGYIAKVED